VGSLPRWLGVHAPERYIDVPASGRTAGTGVIARGNPAYPKDAQRSLPPQMAAEPLIRLPSALAHPQHRADARFLLGVDGGATKTLAAVLELGTGELHMAHGGPSNEDTVGARAAVDTLLAVADEALGRAGTSRRELTTAVLAIAGTDTAAISHQVHACTDAEQWVVVNDVVGAWATATGAGPGVAVISAILSDPDPSRAASRLREALDASSHRPRHPFPTQARRNPHAGDHQPTTV